MSTVINTNIAAVRTHNVYNRNNDYMNTAMTRVATGLKINSAKDGASTWAISEKMRERIRANDQANQNVQNDTALLKTAQGGLSNTIDILKTLKERALDAANDSNMNVDRARIATEVSQLVAQIDDNAAKVKFNGRVLLNGTYAIDGESSYTAAGESTSVSSTVATMTSTTKATAATYEAAGTVTNASFFEYSSKAEDADSAPAAVDSDTFTDAKLVNLVSASETAKNSEITPGDSHFLFHEGDTISLSFTLDGKNYTNTLTVESDTTIGDLLNGKSTATATGTEGLNGNGIKTYWGDASVALSDADNKAIYTITETNTAGIAVKNTANNWTIIGDKNGKLTDVQLTISGSGTEANYTTALNALLGGTSFSSKTSIIGDGNLDTASSGGLTFYVGGEANFGLTFGINAMTSEKLGINKLADSMLNKKTAEASIKTIDEAISKALNEQTKLGSMEARLGYASDNLVTMNENLEAADSTMRDSDVAKEMTNYMKYSVLAQASQYMLAQSSQNAFSVLNLLQA